MRLSKLVVLYDDNGISIDGQVAPWYIDDVTKRFEAYGWNVIGPIDGHDVAAVSAAIAPNTNANFFAWRPVVLRDAIVSVEDTVKGFREILEGKHDDLPEQAFMMVGTIDDAIEKAKKIN